jgi:putative endopeptidase
MIQRSIQILAAALVLFSIQIKGQTAGIQLSYIDSSYKPQTDFYNFCNGKWLKTTKIPESDSRWGSFNEINEFNLKNIKNILDATATSTAAPGTNQQKLRDFYLTAMDSVKADKDGINPIKPLLAKIDAAKTVNDLVKLSAELRKIGISTFVNFDVDVDLNNSKRYAVYLAQSGYALPDRDYYYQPQFEEIRTAYKEHLNKMFELLNFYPESAKGYAGLTYEMEKSLAEHAMNSVQQRDIQKLNNPKSKTQLAALTPGIDWSLYFTGLGIKVPDTVIVANLEFYENLGNVIKKYSVNDWKLFLKWKVIHEAAPFLSSKVENEDFNFFARTVKGAKQMKPRWKRTNNVINAAIGEILGKIYVEKYFSASAKEKVQNMVDNLIASYRERLATRTWMGEETKKQANLKLDLLVKKFGFPDTWKDYSTLTITRESYWKNMNRASEYEYKRRIARLGKPVNRMEWGMTPPTVNAYYNPATNEIAFPAGIMQVPFFDPNADDAFNYGIMGSIIGHELTHGFDDTGAQFDAQGNLKMWWTEQDYKNFKDKTKLIIDQFNGFIAIDTIHVNGSLTQGENIADLGGLTMAYYAYKKSLNGKKSTVMHGFTGEQRFFIAWTQGWKELARDAAVRHLVAVDPHSPGKFRGVAPLTNMKEFYEAFNIKPGDAMFRPENVRVEIW